MTTCLRINRVLSIEGFLSHGSRRFLSPRLMEREDGVFLSVFGWCLSRRKIRTIKRGSASEWWVESSHSHSLCTHFFPLRHGAIRVWWPGCSGSLHHGSTAVITVVPHRTTAPSTANLSVAYGTRSSSRCSTTAGR